MSSLTLTLGHGLTVPPLYAAAGLHDKGSAWWNTQYHWKCLPAWKQHMSFLLVFQWPKPARWSHRRSRGRGLAGKYNATICSENKHKDTWRRTLMNSMIAGSQIYEGDSDIRQSKTDSDSTLMVAHIYWAATLFQSQLLWKLPYIPYLIAWILGSRFQPYPPLLIRQKGSSRGYVTCTGPHTREWRAESSTHDYQEP